MVLKKKYLLNGIVGLFVIGICVFIFFWDRTNEKPQPPKNKKPHIDLALGDRARLKGVEYSISGFKNGRSIHIKAKNALAKDAKVMPHIRTSLKQIIHLKKVFLSSVCNDEIDIEIEAKKGKYDLQKKRIELLDIGKAQFFNKTLQTKQLTLILDTDLTDIKIYAGPFSIKDNSNRVIKRGKDLSGYIHEIFRE